jgi:ribosomal protein S18 acetylase RimI-like enzyme
LSAPREVTMRPARAADAARVAALHAASWRAHYRGSMSDQYLDGPVEAERAAVWKQRLESPRGGQVVLLAEEGDELVGFVCVFLDHDRTFGSFIDNLHVSAHRKGAGIGRTLMRQAGEAMLHAIPQRPAYLYVLEGNHAARAFYERIGGRVVEQGRHVEPDGSEVAVLRFVWDNAGALIAAAQP